MTAAFHIIDKPSETNQCLLHLLVAIIPFLFTRANICHPTVGKFFGCIIQPFVFSLCQGIMVNGGFKKITRNIAFMVASCLWIPFPFPSCCITKSISSLQVTVRFLSCKYDGDPFFNGFLHFCLCFYYLFVALRINH